MNYKDGLRDGLTSAIRVAATERDLADCIFEDEQTVQIYRMAAANIISLLIDEVAIQLGDTEKLELDLQDFGETTSQPEELT